MATITLAPALAPRLPRIQTPTAPAGLGLGTRVQTIFGLQPVERLMAGDLLLDLHGQIVELRGMRRTHLAARDLVQIDPSAMGLGLGRPGPVRPLTLGAGQPVAQRDWRSTILFGGAALVPARALVDGVHVRRPRGGRVVCVLEFDQPALLRVEGLVLRMGLGH